MSLSKGTSQLLLHDVCLKHSYYTCVGLSFSRLFYSNFIVFCGQAPDLVFCLDTGTFEQKEQLLEAFFWSNGDQGKKVAVTSRRSNVPTSQRHDVESPMQKSTSRNVVTSKSRDISTSRRYNVATSARDLHLII